MPRARFGFLSTCAGRAIISPPAGPKTRPSNANNAIWKVVNGIAKTSNDMAAKLAAIISTGRPSLSANQAPSGRAGMIIQLVKLTIALAAIKVEPLKTRYSAPKLSGNIKVTAPVGAVQRVSSAR